MITYLNICIVEENNRAGVKAQWLGALAALLDDPGWDPRTVMAAYNHLYLPTGDPMPSPDTCQDAGSRHTYGVQIYSSRKSTHIKTVKKN